MFKNLSNIQNKWFIVTKLRLLFIGFSGSKTTLTFCSVEISFSIQGIREQKKFDYIHGQMGTRKSFIFLDSKNPGRIVDSLYVCMFSYS